MMKFWKITWALLLSAFLFVSCHNAESAIEDLRDAVVLIDELPEEYDEADLEEINKEYEEATLALEQYEFTDEQKEEILKLHGKYAANMTKASMKVAGKALEGVGKQLKKGLNGFMEGMEEN